MGVFKRGSVYWYKFEFEGQRIQESAKTKSKEEAKRAEEQRRRDLRDGIMGTPTDTRKERARLIETIGDAFVEAYKAKHSSWGFVHHSVENLKRHLGGKMVGQISKDVVADYQIARLKETTKRGGPPAARSINCEVYFLLRMIGKHGEKIREELDAARMLKLKENKDVGRQYAVSEQDDLLKATAESKSVHIHFVLQLALNGGMRDLEIRSLTWAQIDFATNILTVGKSKTDSSSGRKVPLNGEILPVFLKHREWYVRKFGDLKPDWYVFPFTDRGRLDPTRHVKTLKTAWTTARRKAGVKGRFHDTRHTVISQLGEQGASATTIMSIAGHISPEMLKKYSHIWNEAKRTELEKMIAYKNAKRELELKTKRKLELVTKKAKSESAA